MDKDICQYMSAYHSRQVPLKLKWLLSWPHFNWMDYQENGEMSKCQMQWDWLRLISTPGWHRCILLSLEEESRAKNYPQGNKTSTVLISQPQNLSLTFWDLVNRLVPMLPGPAVPGFKQLRCLHLPRSVCQHYPMSTWLKYACNQVTGVSVAAWGKWVSVSTTYCFAQRGNVFRFVCSFVLYCSFAYHTVLFPIERNVNSCFWEIFSFPNAFLLAVILYSVPALKSPGWSSPCVSRPLLSFSGSVSPCLHVSGSVSRSRRKRAPWVFPCVFHLGLSSRTSIHQLLLHYSHFPSLCPFLFIGPNYF